MNPSEIFTAARRKNHHQTLKMRDLISTLASIIPITAICTIIIDLYYRDPSVALAATALLYIGYIIFIRASSVASEYDIGLSYKISIYCILSKWAIIGAISLTVYTPYSLIFITNVLVPDDLHLVTVILHAVGYATYKMSLTNMKVLVVYPVGTFILCFFQFLLVFQEISYRKTEKALFIVSKAGNTLFSLYLAFLWCSLISYYGRSLKTIEILQRV